MTNDVTTSRHLRLLLARAPSWCEDFGFVFFFYNFFLKAQDVKFNRTCRDGRARCICLYRTDKNRCPAKNIGDPVAAIGPSIYLAAPPCLLFHGFFPSSSSFFYPFLYAILNWAGDLVLFILQPPTLCCAVWVPTSIKISNGRPAFLPPPGWPSLSKRIILAACQFHRHHQPMFTLTFQLWKRMPSTMTSITTLNILNEILRSAWTSVGKGMAYDSKKERRFETFLSKLKLFNTWIL